MRITGDFYPHCGSKFLKRKGKNMGNTKNSEVFSNEELEKAIETYNLYIANKEAFKKVYNEQCEYDENKSFLDNAIDEINRQNAEAKIEATHPDAVKLAAYIFEKAICPILKEIEITDIAVPEYGEEEFPCFWVKIENETTQAELSLDCEALRIGGVIVEKKGRKEIRKKILCKGFIEEGNDWVYSQKKFEFTRNNPLSLNYLNETIIPQITNDCQVIIEKAFS